MSSERPQSCSEQRADDLAAHALGALEGPEREALERHLAGCEACRERLLWLQPAVDLLPASVPPQRPSPELRERLLETVRAEAGVATDGTAPADRRPRRRGLPDWLRLPALRPALAGLAVAVLLIGGAVGYGLGAGGDGGGESAEFAALPVSPDLGARGTLVVDGDSGALHVKNLPGLPRDQVYQVWVRHDRDVLPSSVFVAARDGSGEVAIPDKLEGADEILVTREPAGGSSTATTAPLLSAQLD